MSSFARDRWRTTDSPTYPLRQTSTSSNTSSAYSNGTFSYSENAPSRTNTVSSTTSSAYSQMRKTSGHKRGLSEIHEASHNGMSMGGNSPDTFYRNVRQSLRPLPQAPNAVPPSMVKRNTPSYMRTGTLDHDQLPYYQDPAAEMENQSPQTTSPRSHKHHNSPVPHSTTFVAPGVQDLKKSSTSYLRTLSKFAQSREAEDYALTASTSPVTGLQNRRQLKRTDVAASGQKPIDSFSFERTWMDKQRQFLQAYEYLCHIGEAKDWIEDIIHDSIPPIVELEEALRDGVTLAEVVQAFYPDQKLKIFRNAKLQFKHSDNIVLFFRFLEEIGLPELFRFELIDLYEKKNTPKVIYCIHALSWLLYRKGMVGFKIGNLVGQLQFDHHDLERTQKGLDNAGVSMPSFHGMGASFGAEPEPEPEPVETEEQRIARELHEQESTVIDFQNQIRGALVRVKLGDMMNGLWEAEGIIIEMQSRVRGDFARQVFGYRLSMKVFAMNLQAASRAFLTRRRQRQQEELCQHLEPQVLKLQSLIRARRTRYETRQIKVEGRKHDAGIKTLQAAIRGALARREAEDQLEDVKDSSKDVRYLQAAIRGMVSRQQIQREKMRLQNQGTAVVSLQATIRGLLSRSEQARVSHRLESYAIRWSSIQSAVRGMQTRQQAKLLKEALRSKSNSVALIQAHIRRARIQERHSAMRHDLFQANPSIQILQSAIHGFILRHQATNDKAKLKSFSSSFCNLQSAIRAARLRQDVTVILTELQSVEPEIIQLQGLSRAMMCRFNVGNLLAELEDHDEAVAQLQAAIRGGRIRAAFVEKKRFFHENMQKVVKIQSVVRAKIQGSAYKSLTAGKNPPVSTLKGFVHLLNDNDFDFNEEVEAERLRKNVIQHVRQNELADQYIQQLDIKIALLVKNKITLDEVVKHQKNFGGLQRSSTIRDPFDLKALNKNSRNKLEHYQELFFLLQTQPHYLAKLFRRMREQTTSEKECERVKHLVTGMFGYAQKRREEYYLAKLIVRSVHEEVDSAVSLQDYIRSNSFCNKLFSTYSRGQKDRKFFRDTLGRLVKEQILDNRGLDLESDPMQVYLSSIKNEELRTGRRSQRNPNVTREEAIRDPETRSTFIAHMQDLRDICDQVFLCLEEHVNRMPFGTRYITQQKYEHLLERFPNEDHGFVLQLVGHWVWRHYLQPALVEPEKVGVADRALTQEQKRNLSEVAKVLNQAASGREFGGDNVYLQPLNSYLKDAVQRFGTLWNQCISIPTAEQHYDIDEFNDLYAKTKPTLFIKMADIFSIHQLVASEVGYICPNQDDALREILRELGSVKNIETEFMHVSTGEITLTLTPKYLGAQDPEADVKALFTETKRCILYIIRIQAGSSLLEILVKPILREDEEKWETLVRDELLSAGGRKSAYAEATNILDISTLSYPDLKRIALENVLELEQIGRLSRSNKYQDLLNAIAVDIRTKHRRRLQRQRELEGIKTTLARLNDQALYLEQQLKTYNDYIEQAMVTLQNKKGKKKFLLPFTKQWDHERELQRSGRSFRFGSYKYSARTLADKGVLVHWRGYLEAQWHRVDLTISSNEVGVFMIDGSSGNMMIPGASAQVPLDDLLQAQFNNTQYMEFFEGRALRVNVNLFLHLIMKKFYNE